MNGAITAKLKIYVFEIHRNVSFMTLNIYVFEYFDIYDFIVKFEHVFD